jgi:hypothetical protein
MKKMILSCMFIAAATLSAWKPAEQSSAKGNTNSVNKYSLLPITPIASYGAFNATTSGFFDPSVTFSWTTTAETNVVRFKVYRLHIPTSQIVFQYINATSTSFPRSYTITDNDVAAGSTYYYSVCAVSSDQTEASCSQSTQVNVPGVTFRQGN